MFNLLLFRELTLSVGVSRLRFWCWLVGEGLHVYDAGTRLQGWVGHATQLAGRGRVLLANFTHAGQVALPLLGLIQGGQALSLRG